MPKKQNRRLRKKLYCTICLVMVYLLGQNIPIPGTHSAAVSEEAAGLFEFIQSALGSGGEDTTLFSLGLMPYMSASILMSFYRKSKKSEKNKDANVFIQRRTKLLALCFAVFQAVIRASGTEAGGGFLEKSYIAVILTAGTFQILWLTEQNSQYGIGGMSAFILVNILRNAAKKLTGSGGGLSAGELWIIPMLAAVVILTVAFEYGEIRIPVQKVLIHSDMAEESFMAVKMNPAGTQPAMYVMSFYLLPYYMVKGLELLYPGNRILSYLYENMDYTRPVGLAVFLCLFCLVTVGLAFLYIDPKEIAGQMQKSGDCIPGVRPGGETESCLRRTVLFCAFTSAAAMGICIGLPFFVQAVGGRSNGLYSMPMTLMILSGIILNIREEGSAVRDLDSYAPFL